MSRSLVVYRGPSAYDPSTTIRAVLVLRSKNVKTGDMAQLHILHDTVPPHDAQRTGDDAAVCGGTCTGGGCALRPVNGGGCYVLTLQGPLRAFRGSQGVPVAGAAVISHALRGRRLRLGAYGDPAALPTWVVAQLALAAGGKVTGYTHGWRDRPDLQRWCMASVETEAHAAEAHAAGWRTFRARRVGAPLMSTEIQCPSERVECADCLLCHGTTLRARSISIEVHGNAARKALRVVA